MRDVGTERVSQSRSRKHHASEGRIDQPAPFHRPRSDRPGPQRACVCIPPRLDPDRVRKRAAPTKRRPKVAYCAGGSCLCCCVRPAARVLSLVKGIVSSTRVGRCWPMLRDHRPRSKRPAPIERVQPNQSRPRWWVGGGSAQGKSWRGPAHAPVVVVIARAYDRAPNASPPPRRPVFRGRLGGAEQEPCQAPGLQGGPGPLRTAAGRKAFLPAGTGCILGGG